MIRIFAGDYGVSILDFNSLSILDYFDNGDIHTYHTMDYISFNREADHIVTHERGEELI